MMPPSSHRPFCIRKPDSATFPFRSFQSRSDQMESSAQQVTPEITWRVMTGFQMSAAFKAAIELELFTKIGEGKKTAAEIANATGAAERGIRILADAMTVLGLLTKSGDEYSLTDESAAFLDKNSRMYLGSATDFLMGPTQMRGFEDFTNAVRHG